jgi:hypothetical protein
MILLLTTVVGETYHGHAARLAASLAAWSWPPLLVVDEAAAAAAGIHDLEPRGRGLKTRWAEFIPAGHTGPAMFLDADCEAVGPYLGLPAHPPGIVSATVRQRFLGGKIWWESNRIFAADRAAAIALCRRWHAWYRAQGEAAKQDEPALNWTLAEFATVDLGGSFDDPWPNIRHHGTEAVAAGRKPPAR